MTPIRTYLPSISTLQGFHSHGKSWKKVVMESWGKVMENSKNSGFPGNLFARKKVMEKSWKSVVQIRLNVFLLCRDQCGSRLYSSVSYLFF